MSPLVVTCGFTFEWSVNDLLVGIDMKIGKESSRNKRKGKDCNRHHVCLWISCRMNRQSHHEPLDDAVNDTGELRPSGIDGSVIGVVCGIVDVVPT